MRSAQATRSGTAAAITFASNRLVGPWSATIAARLPSRPNGAAMALSPASRSSIAAAYPRARTRSISCPSAAWSVIVQG